jgi:WD40 repeat protein
MTTPSTSSEAAANAGQERSLITEIDTNNEIRAVTFTANGEHLVSGGTEGVRVWRVKDGTQVASMQVGFVRCLAVSKDGRWIAAGTYKEVVVWDAETYEHVFANVEAYLNGVDFSPDSTRLVTGSLNNTVSVWNIAARQRVLGPLQHPDIVIAAKYAPDGTQIATATPDCVRVYDTNDGGLLLNIPVKVPPWYNTGLLWSTHCLFVVSDSTIKQIDVSAPSEISEWQVPDSNDSSCIALPQHGGYIAYATKRTVTLWDMSTRSQLGFIEHPQDIRSIVLSPDNLFLVIAGESGKITINCLAHINASVIVLECGVF